MPKEEHFTNKVFFTNIHKVSLTLLLLLCPLVHGTCTPVAVKDALHQCLMNNNMGTYYQFPIVPDSNYYNLCFNVSCLSYCMTLAASPCSTQDFITHLGNGDALSAAYLGLCDQLETEVKAALVCGNSVSNQDALNTISLFQTSLENSYAASSENTTVICSEWVTMKDALYVLIQAQCSGTALTFWQTFLNTVTHECDATLSPSWYADYRETSDTRCSGTVPLLYSVSCQLLMVVILHWTFIFVTDQI